jgi:hypothetical protein
MMAVENLFKCMNCKKRFNYDDGVVAEIVDNKIVTNSCHQYTPLTELCNVCVEKLGVETESPDEI